MSIRDFFRPVELIDADEVRRLIKEKRLGEYNLVDVRQPHEYEEGHLPGSVLIPLSELPRRAGELDPARPTVAYCRSGKRSLSAAAILDGAGFSVKSMDGGIGAYHGLVATGGPEAGMAFFAPGTTTPELTALAWLLEDGTEKFYHAACQHICKEREHKELISMLESAEDAHKKRLLETCSTLMGREPLPDFPKGIMELPAEDIMEGGVKVSEALEWARGRKMREVLELMMALEANALDLYIRMSRRVEDDGARRVFETLAEEEKAHLEKLSGALSGLA